MKASPASAPGRWATTPSERGELLARADLRGRAFCDAWTAAADGWLATLLGDERDIALVAVGGYGRGEMAPGSDLDVVLLHKGRRDIAGVADRVWYPIWDARVGLDHSVRTVKEALVAADEDLKAALGLLDARLVAGDAALFAALQEKVAAQWRQQGEKRLVALSDMTADRHRRFGPVAFLLEPDVKEGEGGLRDLTVVSAITAAGGTSAANGRLRAAHDLLLDVRVELHRTSGRPSDRLTLQDQDAVARALGVEDADALMSRVAAAARTVTFMSRQAWRSVERVDELDLPPGAAADAQSMLWLAAAAARQGAPILDAALERLAQDVERPSDPWPEGLRDSLVDLLDAGEAAVEVWEALDQHDLVTRLIPEWAEVRSRPQRNAYHRFTVDRHLWEAAAEAAKLVRSVSRPDVLLVGTLLHDIGKGYAGDHTAAGIDLVATLARRMGFDEADAAMLVAMVRHHLLLPDVATRRDLDDPTTIEAVAAAVESRDLLDLLEALTEADSRATGPTAWSPWKAALVATLAARVRERLAGGAVTSGPAVTEAQRAMLARRRLAFDVDERGDVVTVVAPDRPGLLCRVAGVLALHGLDVVAATAASEDGMAVEELRVISALDTPTDWTKVEADLERALAGRLALDARVAERARAYAARYRTASVAPAPRVIVVDDASATATVIEVRAPDGVGVLYRITRALAECDLDVRSARVATLGHEVVDAFYVTDAAGGKLHDPEHLREVERAILTELARPGWG